jgi:hypothetical protein
MREWKGVVPGFSWLWATGRRFCHKTQQGPAKFVYAVPPIGRKFPSVVDNSKVWGIWYGLDECLIFQLAGWGGWTGSGAISFLYHHTTWIRERGRKGGCVPSPWCNPGWGWQLGIFYSIGWPSRSLAIGIHHTFQLYWTERRGEGRYGIQVVISH